MNLKKKKLLAETHQYLIDIGLGKQSLDDMDQYVAEEVMGYGSTIDEKNHCFLGFRGIYERQQEQIKRLKVNFHSIPIWRKISTDENTAIYVDEYQMNFQLEGEEIPVFVRATTIFEYVNHRWKLIHWHVSKPSEISEEDTLHIKEWQLEKAKLEKLVAEKTADLVQKNRELEIETALERVRAASMAMKHSSQFIEVNKILRNQLDVLGLVTEFDTVEILLFDEDVEIITSYQTQDLGLNQQWKIEIAIDELPEFRQVYNDWKAIPPAQRKGNLAIIEFQGDRFDALMEWTIEKRARTAAEKEAFIELGKQLKKTGWYIHCVFFRDGAISLGGNHRLSAPQLSILYRFAATFEQTYIRFLDLQKAEAQAKEAQIEAAVERVRAKALAMHDSTKILEVAVALRQQIVDLDLPGISAATIYLEQADGSIRMWDLTEMIESENGPILSMDIAFKLEDIDEKLWINDVWRSNQPYFMTKMDDTQYPIAADFLRKYIPAAAEPYEQFIKATQLKESWHPVVPIVDGKGRLTVDFLLPPPAIIETILPKMGAAFDLAYTRFKDLQQSEIKTKQLEKIFNENQRLLHSILPEPIGEN